MSENGVQPTTASEPQLQKWIEGLQSGVLKATARTLVERLSEGEITRERLALAAYLGHQPAVALIEAETLETATQLGNRTAVEAVLGEDDMTLDDFFAWVSGISRWGVEAVAYAHIAAARVLLKRLTPTADGIEVARSYLDVLRRADDLVAPAPGSGPASAGEGDPGRFTRAYALVEEALLSACGRPASEAAKPDASWATGGLKAAVARSSVRPRNLGRAIRDDLVPWALGDERPRKKGLGTSGGFQVQREPAGAIPDAIPAASPTPAVAPKRRRGLDPLGWVVFAASAFAMGAVIAHTYVVAIDPVLPKVLIVGGAIFLQQIAERRNRRR